MYLSNIALLLLTVMLSQDTMSGNFTIDGDNVACSLMFIRDGISSVKCILPNDAVDSLSTFTHFVNDHLFNHSLCSGTSFSCNEFCTLSCQLCPIDSLMLSMKLSSTFHIYGSKYQVILNKAAAFDVITIVCIVVLAILLLIEIVRVACQCIWRILDRRNYTRSNRKRKFSHLSYDNEEPLTYDEKISKLIKCKISELIHED